MSTFDEAKAVVECLWAEEIAEIDRREEEIEAAVEEIRDTHVRISDEVAEGERELATLRAALEELPRRLGLAQLQADDMEVIALQGRFASVRDRAEAVEGALSGARERLREIGDLDEAEGRVRSGFWARGARAELAERVRDEFRVLREALEDRLDLLAPRSQEERSRDEDLAARRRRDGHGPLPSIRVVGGSAPPRDGSGIEIVEDGMGGIYPARNHREEGGLVVVDPGPPAAAELPQGPLEVEVGVSLGRSEGERIVAEAQKRQERRAKEEAAHGPAA